MHLPRPFSFWMSPYTRSSRFFGRFDPFIPFRFFSHFVFTFDRFLSFVLGFLSFPFVLLVSFPGSRRFRSLHVCSRLRPTVRILHFRLFVRSFGHSLISFFLLSRLHVCTSFFFCVLFLRSWIACTSSGFAPPIAFLSLTFLCVPLCTRFGYTFHGFDSADLHFPRILCMDQITAFVIVYFSFFFFLLSRFLVRFLFLRGLGSWFVDRFPTGFLVCSLRTRFSY